MGAAAGFTIASILCGIAQELRERLASKGLIVESEVLPSIKEALQHLLTIGMK